MKPIKLTMSGFITYRDREVVEFEKFSQENLFIISGPTGSGKSTIFDAICYALYGSVSTKMRSASDDEELRCHYLTPQDAETFVELTFEERGILYRVRRTPLQYLIKRRKKPSEVKRTAELFQCKGEEWVHVSSKITEVDEEIQRIIGLKKEQFTKIVLLPQGEFASFLSSKSDEKLEILRRIFGTEIYQQFEWALREEARVLNSSVEALEHTVNNYVVLLDEEIKESLGDFIKAGRLEPTFYQEFIEKLREIIAGEDQRRASLKEKQSRLDEKIRGLDFALKQQVEENKRIAEYRQLKEVHRKMQERQEEYEALRQSLAGGQKTERIAVLEEHLRNREGDVQHNKQLLEKEETRLKESESKLREVTPLYEKVPELEERARTLEMHQRQLEEDLQRLDDIFSKTLFLKDLQEKFRGIQKTRDGEQAKLEDCLQSIRSLGYAPGTRESLEKNLSELESISRQKREQIVAARDLYKNLAEGREKQREIQRAEQRIQSELEPRERKLKEDLEKLLRIREEQALYRYAENLREGDPCPLCGSEHHPAMIQCHNPVTETEKEEADKNYNVLRDHLLKTRGVVEEGKNIVRNIHRRVEENREELHRMEVEFPLTGDFSKDFKSAESLGLQMKEAIEGLDVKINHIKEELQALSLREKKLLELEKEKDALKDALNLLNIELASTAKERDYTEKSIQEKRKSVLHEGTAEVLQGEKEKKSREIGDVRKQVETLRREYVEAEKAVDSFRKGIDLLKSREKELSEKKEEAARTFKEGILKDFGDRESYRKSRLAYQQDLPREKEMEDYFDELRRMEGRLDGYEKSYKNKQEEDLQGLERALQEVREEDRENRDQRELVEKKITMMEAAHDNIVETTRGYEEALARRNRAVRLDAITRGIGQQSSVLSGTQKINFETFVLMYHFDGVLAYANQRLYKMTEGQYEMVRKRDIGSNVGKQGLDINVIDTNTGKERSSQTLSGGESFLASLSLALGMSDEMMGFAGAVDIDTLFIDEGFGTLDSEMLQNAIECLQDLTGNRRLVGIISHVEDLKDRIPNKILVEYTKDKGSTLRVVSDRS